MIKNKNSVIHWWIWVFGAVSILANLSVVIGAYVTPEMFYPEFAEEIKWSAPWIKHLLGLVASTHIAIIVVLIFGYVTRQAKVLIAIYAFSFIVDTINIWVHNTAYFERNIVSMGIVWLLLSVPAALAAWHLWKRAAALQNQ